MPAPTTGSKANKIVIPVLIVVALALAGACGWLFMTGQKAATRADTFEQAVAGLIEKAGATEIDAASLKSDATVADTLNQLTATVEAKTAELETVKESLATASAEALSAKTASDALNTRIAALTTEASTATQALAGKDAEVAAAKKTAEDAQKATEEAKAQATAAQADVATRDARIAKLLGALTAAGLAEPDAAPAEEAAAPGDEAATAPAAEGTTPAAETPAAEEQPPPAVQRTTTGLSEMFKSAKYNSKKQVLELTMVNDVVLTYSDVPENIYTGLQQTADLDIFYRFKIAGTFACTPDDKQATLDLVRTTLRKGNLARKPVLFSP